MTSQSVNSVQARRGATTHMDKSDLFEMLCMGCATALMRSLLKDSSGISEQSHGSLADLKGEKQ